MSAACIGIIPSLPSNNPNANRTDKRLVQLTRTNGRTTRMAGHDDNFASNMFKMTTNCLFFFALFIPMSHIFLFFISHLYFFLFPLPSRLNYSRMPPLLRIADNCYFCNVYYSCSSSTPFSSPPSMAYLSLLCITSHACLYYLF